MVALTFCVSIVMTLAMLAAERHHPDSDIHSLWDAFYFTVSQMTTLSSTMENPVTRVGQVVVLFMDIYAITVVSTLAGMFGAFFYHRTDERRSLAAQRQQEPGREHGSAPATGVGGKNASAADRRDGASPDSGRDASDR
ncbi:MAG: hypothetical protein KDK89_02815 [Alphaproteobacteria bacterium]|nr:hypothetical protein [Alphaproteobacteria bacterium]